MNKESQGIYHQLYILNLETGQVRLGDQVSERQWRQMVADSPFCVTNPLTAQRIAELYEVQNAQETYTE